MDFLLVPSARIDDAWARARLPRLRICQPGTLSAEDCGPARLYHFGDAAAVAPDGGRHLLFGQAFDGDTLLSELDPPDGPALAGLWRGLESHGLHVAGSFCCLRLRPGSGPEAGRVTLRTDAFNAYPVFWADAGDGLWAVSNNLHMARAALEHAGLACDLDLLPKVCAITIGSGRHGRTIYRGIRTLADCSRIEAGSTLTLVSEIPEVLEPLLDLPYERAIETAAERLEGRIAALARRYGPEDGFFDVTGGLDSRLIFAGLLAAGCETHWPMRNFGPPDAPDTIHAAVLAHRHGLRQIRGLDTLLHRLVTLPEAWQVETYTSMGSSPKTGGDPLRRFPGQIHLHGGFGEIAGASSDTKRFHANRLRDGGGVRGLAAGYAAYVARTGLMANFAPGTRTEIEDEIADRLDTFVRLGLDPLRATLLFYANGQMRAHFGLISRLNAQVRSHPDCLYDPALLAAAMTLPIDKAVGARVNFDLIRRLGGDALAAMPIAGGAWDRSALPAEADADAFVRPRLGPGPLPPGVEPAPKVPFGRDAEVLTATDHAGSRERRAADPTPPPAEGVGPQQHRLLLYREMLRGALADPPVADRLMEHFDAGTLATLAEADAATLTKWCNRVAIHALSQCIILARGEERSVFDLPRDAGDAAAE